MGGLAAAGWLVAGALLLGAGCTSFDTVRSGDDGAGDQGSPGGGDDGAGGDEASGPGPDAGSVAGADASPVEDHDGDGVVDALDDCTLLVDDDLADDHALLEPAPGFDDDSWEYELDGYHQTRVGDDAGDVSLFQLGRSVRNVRIEVELASTDWDEYDSKDLRQIMLVARAVARDDDYQAVGCGIEVVEGMDPTPRTSVVAYAGSPGSPGVTGVDRTPRDSVSASEPVLVRMELVGGHMTCTVTQDGDEITEAEGSVPDRQGAIGFETRESAALFKHVRACQLP